MKNFYEATVTKPSLFLGIKLTLEPIGEVSAQVQINDQKWTATVKEQNFVVDTEVPLTDSIDFSIQIKREHPSALKIQLEIDGYEILPKYQHLACPPVDYLDHEQVWTLSIPNFYPWYHKITGQGWIA